MLPTPLKEVRLSLNGRNGDGDSHRPLSPVAMAVEEVLLDGR